MSPEHHRRTDHGYALEEAARQPLILWCNVRTRNIDFPFLPPAIISYFSSRKSRSIGKFPRKSAGTCSFSTTTTVKGKAVHQQSQSTVIHTVHWHQILFNQGHEATTVQQENNLLVIKSHRFIMLQSQFPPFTLQARAHSKPHDLHFVLHTHISGHTDKHGQAGNVSTLTAMEQPLLCKMFYNPF